MRWIYLVLIAAVLIVGISVVLVNRWRAGRPSLPPVPPTHEIDHPPPRGAHGTAQAPGTTLVVEPVPAADSPTADLAVVEEAVVDVPVDVPVEAPVEIVEVPVERTTLRSRMAKARSVLTGAFLGVRSRAGITVETWDDLEEALLRADVGIRVTTALLDPLRQRVKAKEITTPDELLAALQAEMTSRLDGADRDLCFEPATEVAAGPNVWLFVGVNGVGKTTTIGKVGAMQREEGRTVLMAAGDTFRAAAAEQLGTWAERSGAEMVRGNEGGDPSAVIFDAIERATARQYDLVLADTAGRLHTKTNLMDELRKVRRVAAKGAGRVTEVLLVIDATTGQNGLTQAREFGEATEVTGVVLTKLDGSAKGGIVFAIETELGLPVKLVGLGESIEDLVVFDPTQFVDALFSEN